MFRNRCLQYRLLVMKDPIEVLRRKEAELLQLQEEVEALRQMLVRLNGRGEAEALRPALEVIGLVVEDRRPATEVRGVP